MKHLYTNQNDKIAAESSEEARQIWEDCIGEPYDDEEFPWELVPDNEILIITFEDEIKPEYLPEQCTISEHVGECWKISAKASDWAQCKLAEDGILCSEEY